MKKKVLFIDDDRLIVSTMSKGLRLSGYDVSSALSGAEAKAFADSVALDIAIVDIYIPDLSGIALAKYLIEMHHLPVIFLSAYCDHETVIKALECGCMNYLIKPCSLQQIILTIEAVYEKNQEIRQLKEQSVHLNKALSQSQDVCIAMGLLMDKNSINQQQAFEILRTKARSERRKVADLAREIIMQF